MAIHTSSEYTPLTNPPGRHINGDTLSNSFGDGYHVDSIGSSQYGYQIMGYYQKNVMVDTNGEIRFGGYFRQSDTFTTALQPNRRHLRAYLLDHQLGMVEFIPVLEYTDGTSWTPKSLAFDGLTPGDEYKIAFGRGDGWSRDWKLVAEWAGVTIGSDINMVGQDYFNDNPNILDNPGFESGFTDWTRLSGNSYTVPYNVRTNSYSLRAYNLENPRFGEIGGDITIRQTIDSAALQQLKGHTICFSYWFGFASADDWSQATIWYEDNSGPHSVHSDKVYATEEPGYDWTNVRVTASIPDSTTAMYVEMYFLDDNYPYNTLVYVDDASVSIIATSSHIFQYTHYPTYFDLLGGLSLVTELTELDDAGSGYSIANLVTSIAGWGSYVENPYCEVGGEHTEDLYLVVRMLEIQVELMPRVTPGWPNPDYTTQDGEIDVDLVTESSTWGSAINPESAQAARDSAVQGMALVAGFAAMVVTAYATAGLSTAGQLAIGIVAGEVTAFVINVITDSITYVGFDTEADPVNNGNTDFWTRIVWDYSGIWVEQSNPEDLSYMAVGTQGYQWKFKKGEDYGLKITGSVYWGYSQHEWGSYPYGRYSIQDTGLKTSIIQYIDV